MPQDTYAKITDECLNCGACDPACPEQAIFEGDEYYEVDKDICLDRDSSDDFICIDQCPVDCISIIPV